VTAGADSFAQALFLRGARGQVFASARLPVAQPMERAVLFLPPFAEEMNKSRRMFTLAARALATHGTASMVVDLYGTGDSAGTFAEARWATWRADVLTCCEWLHEQGCPRIVLTGLRMGALLALDAAPTVPHLERIVLWQPVVAGDAMLNQFLRTDVVAQMLAQADARSSTESLRKRLQSGETIEVAGYALAPDLVAAIESLKLESLPRDATPPIDWLEVIPDSSRGGAPAGLRVRQAWQTRGLCVAHRVVSGPPFWSSAEIATAPDLVQATLAVLEIAA
jgi:exosortase A-associated hydrolase 2